MLLGVSLPRIVSVRPWADRYAAIDAGYAAASPLSVTEMPSTIGFTRDEAGVFAALRDEALFREAKIVVGAITWPGELDLAPDAMYRAIRKNGSCCL